MQLSVGTDSTWSLRTMIGAKIAELPVDLHIFSLQCASCQSVLRSLSPTGLVPFLEDGSLRLHDSLAMLEYLNELSDGKLYPTDQGKRALSRSLCAEMHAGFSALRQTMPFTLADVSPLTAFSPAQTADIARVTTLFASAEGPFYQGDKPTAVDAFYAVLAYRLQHYGVRLQGEAGQYQQQLVAWSFLQEALAQLTSTAACCHP
ncbi:glutathione S-transferase N-terminal domain-containing protein [Rosenbergiella epipactidis]|uniref:glutathione S-transferase N-terminal domain-containing protein n=1 Tax=Rosenbergiella epipactidis TaxID=1544694 RepID=UPI001F4E066F|nr:glutathione S-transferase N-terminal domain-containing protein [Rosenbergiella epipactidis]